MLYAAKLILNDEPLQLEKILIEITFTGKNIQRLKKGLEWLDWGRHVLIPLLGLWPKLSALRLE